MIGETIAHYRIVGRPGEGGMGMVSRARDTHLNHFVAIKVLPPELGFVQEAKVASALNRPNIVVVHDLVSEAGAGFIVMEHVAGRTLDQLITHKGMRLGGALKIAIQVAGAVARAQEAGIVHRHLKLLNVMVDEHGVVKVADFGLAKLTETSLLYAEWLATAACCRSHRSSSSNRIRPVS